MIDVLISDPSYGQTWAICDRVGSLESTVQAEAYRTQRLIEEGFAQVSHELREGFDRVEQGLSRLDRTLRAGFTQIMEELAVLRMSSAQLVAIARTPAHTAALEHYASARDSYLRGLLPEALHDLERAINGVPGVSAGYQTDWRFHALRGLIYLGVGAHRDDRIVNPAWAYQCLEYAIRYLDPPDHARRSAFITCCGQARSLFGSEATDDEAMRLFLDAIGIDGGNVEARMDLARVAARRGRAAEGLPHVLSACQQNLRCYSAVEHDPRLAAYRAEVAHQKAACVHELRSRVPVLCAHLVESTSVVERRVDEALSKSRLRPNQDAMVERSRRSQAVVGIGAGVMAVVGMAMCYVPEKISGRSIAGFALSRGHVAALALLGACLLIVGSIVMIVAHGPGAKKNLDDVTRSASIRIRQNAASAWAACVEPMRLGVRAADAWLDEINRLVILGADDVAARQRGAAACARLRQIAEKARQAA